MGMPRSAGPNTQHEGVVKSKGEKYGFIEARGVQETYGKDALVSPKSTGADIYASLAVGSLVRFRLELENGRPVASRCQKIKDGAIKNLEERRYEPYAKAGKTAQPPKEKGPAETAPEGEIEAVDRSFKGVVKTKFKSYGFIESPDSVAIYGRDIFFSTKKISIFKKIKEGLEVGSTVEVNVQLHDGQPRVTRVLEINGEPI